MLSPEYGGARIPSKEEEETVASSSSLNYLTYAYRENLFAEFERILREEKRFDGLIIDLMNTGFSLPLDSLVKFHAYARRLLKPQGVLLFIKADSAVTLTKDDPGGGLTFNVYDSPFGIFARYPMLADYVCATVSGIDRRRMHGGGSTLANHILYTSTPVLTPQGQKAKDNFELSPPKGWVLQCMDDYTSVESITNHMESHHKIHPDETLRLLQEMETENLIYPVFTRIQFLANCYHNHKPFRLGRYMVAANIITAAQLEELLEMQQGEGWGRNQKTFLGLLAVKRGLLNTRELEILLHDQYLYGGYHKVEKDDSSASSRHKRSIETMKNSMIGSLGAIDGAGLLQSIATAKKTGTLTVEDRDKSFAVLFQDGRPTHSRLGKLSGQDAVSEFLVSWSEGIFVFRDGSVNAYEDECKLHFPLDKLLLDAALYQDNVNQIISMQPGQRNVIFERVQNFNQAWKELAAGPLTYFDETTVQEADKEKMPRIGSLIDGLTTLDEVIKSFDEWPTHMVLKTVQLFIDHRLVEVQQTSLFKPLAVFQKMTAELNIVLGAELNHSVLESSLHHVHGSKNSSSRFNIDKDGRVSVNLSQVKDSNTPVSTVLLELRRWMEAYLVFARRQTDPRKVDTAIARVVHSS